MRKLFCVALFFSSSFCFSGENILLDEKDTPKQNQEIVVFNDDSLESHKWVICDESDVCHFVSMDDFIEYDRQKLLKSTFQKK